MGNGIIHVIPNHPKGKYLIKERYNHEVFFQPKSTE